MHEWKLVRVTGDALQKMAKLKQPPLLQPRRCTFDFSDVGIALLTFSSMQRTIMKTVTRMGCKKTSPAHSIYCLLAFLLTFIVPSSWALDDLSNAAIAGDRVKMEALIANEAEMKGEKGGTALHLAARTGQYQTVEALIAHGANVNYRNQRGETPLHRAIAGNKKEIVELLIAHGADVNAKDIHDSSLIERALMGSRMHPNGNPELAALLLAKGARLDGVSGPRELRKAATAGNTQMVQLLLANRVQINSKDEYGLTPLYWAIAKGHGDLARLLIAHGADVNIVSQNGIPLTHGIRNSEMMNLLLEHGADVAGKDRNGNTVLHGVTDDKELTELVLAHGANVNSKNESGNTPLHMATGKGHYDGAKVLLAHKADVNAKNNLWQTPLFDAIAFEGRLADPAWRARLRSANRSRRAVGGTERLPPGAIRHSEIANAKVDSPTTRNVAPGPRSFEPTMKTITLLLEHGADVNAKDRSGETPLHAATTAGIVEFLLARGVPVDVPRSDGATPLHLAAVYGRSDVVKALLAHGANVNARTKDGITPLHYGSGIEVVKSLLASRADASAMDSRGNTPLYMADEPGVVELLLAHGASINTRNTIGQTPLLRVVRTYISNLLPQGSMSGPLGDFSLVEHGGRIEVIKALLGHGADIDLEDREGCMPLFYVREAIRRRAYIEILPQFQALENLLLAHGAKLEKRKKEDTTNRSKAFRQHLPTYPKSPLGHAS